MKKGIIFNCLDNFGKEYRYVVVCDESKVNEVIKKEKELSTEIVNTEIVYGDIR